MASERSARCVNRGSCALADDRLTIAAGPGPEPACPECGRALVLIAAREQGGRWPQWAGPLAGIVVVLVALGLWWRWQEARPDPARSVEAVTASSVAPEAILRLAGSNTIGSKLAPALATAYLIDERGCASVRRATPAPDETLLTCRAAGLDLAVAIAAHGSGTAFAGLAAGAVDIGMSSRAIKADEVASLSALGDMRASASEHVIGRDGIAVVVHPSNPVERLDRDEVAAIFSGVVADWAQVGGTPGPIRLYARDDKSGTFDTFKALVLDGAALSPRARRFEDSRALSDGVVADRAGIGFIGLPYIGGAKPLALSVRGATPVVPNRLTVATEDYLLARRLYLYTAPASARRDVRRFVDYVFSARGQGVVEREGFVSRKLAADSADPAPTTGSPRVGLTAGARRLSTNFQFASAAAVLDTSSVRALGEVADYLSGTQTDPSRLMLLGFADGRGGKAINCALSERRAEEVARRLAERGVVAGTVRGLCDANPIGDDRTAEGQARNRRVEAWVRQ